MRNVMIAAIVAGIALLAACNTVHGVGEDARSVGRVFSHDPDGNDQRRNR